MKKNLLISMILLVSSLIAQNLQTEESVSFDSNNTRDHEYWKKTSFNVGGALLVPQGKLKEILGVVPMVDLGLNVPINDMKSIGLNIQYGVPSSVKSFSFENEEGVKEAQVKSIFNAYVSFNKRLVQKKKTYVSAGLGIGISSLNTNSRNPNYDHDQENSSKYESISAFLLTPGITFKRKFDKDEFSISLNLNYSPYNTSRGFYENMSGTFLVPKISYRF